MPHNDDFGFWDDERGHDRTGPIPRLSRRPRSATERSVPPGEPTVSSPRVPFADAVYSREQWSAAGDSFDGFGRAESAAGGSFDGGSFDDGAAMWAEPDRSIPLLVSRRRGAEQRPNFVMRRIAVLVALGVVAAPIAMLLGGSDDDQRVAADSVVDQVTVPTISAAAATLPSVQPVTPVVPQPAASVATVPVTPASTAAPSTASIGVATTAEVVAALVTSPDTVGSVAESEVAVTTSVPETTEVKATTAPAAIVAPPSCDDYEVVVGDYWILIADKVSVELSEVLDANRANVDTPLYPGRTICLPSNASAPTTAAPTTAAPTTAAPTTAAPTTTVKPTTTVQATTTTVRPTTTAPATTAAPSTTIAPPKNIYTKAEVTQIIRDIWPDDLENEAIRIATRESNLIPTVRNSCCYGLFQLYWNVHKTWMTASGVTAPEQLYDPRVNAYMAYAMYLRAGGWGPWS